MPDFSYYLSGEKGLFFGWKVGMKIALGKYNKQSVVTGNPIKLSCFPTACITGVIFFTFFRRAKASSAGWQRETPTMGKAQKVSGTPCSLCAVDLR